MRKRCYIFSIFILLCSSAYCQTININSITMTRQPNGDNGYTLDAYFMILGARPKLLSTTNFGPNGVYHKTVSIYDGYGTTGSLTQVYTVPLSNVFFFGSFNKLEASTQQFTNAEVDSLYNWSKRGGKLIIATQAIVYGDYDPSVLNSKWGFSLTRQLPTLFIPTIEGNNTDIFNGPFGNVTLAEQAGGSQGFFNTIPTNSKVLATDGKGNPTLFIDCNTLDLIAADVDGYTDLSNISIGATVINEQDRFWVNTIVFMDKLQPFPFVTNMFNILSLNSTYVDYQWYFDSVPINGAVNKFYTVTRKGNYFVEVTLNGGCKVKSNIIEIDTLFQKDSLIVPNIVTPNGDNFNDVFKVKYSGEFENYKLMIFNRWGLKIFQTEKINAEWDCYTRTEMPVPDGTYYYIIYAKAIDGKEYNLRGNITIIR